jgi:hypothetical protein
LHILAVVLILGSLSIRGSAITALPRAQSMAQGFDRRKIV